MAEAKDILNDMLNAYKKTSDYRDSAVMDIGLNKAKYEEHLDKMWAAYGRGLMLQAVEYKKQVQYIKDAGFTVKRSKTTGRHKIV
jgi:hypothetical protein